MSVTIATAPCCWGVDDLRNPHLLPWERVLDEPAAAGFGGLELGPYGHMPLDPGVMTEALDRRGCSSSPGPSSTTCWRRPTGTPSCARATRSAPRSRARPGRRRARGSATPRPTSP